MPSRRKSRRIHSVAERLERQDEFARVPLLVSVPNTLPVRPSTKLIVLDFDGTVTDIEKEAEPFVEVYKQKFTRAFGIGSAELQLLWEQARQKVLSSPATHGMEFDGKIVAPAYADPYTLNTAIAIEILKTLVILPDPEEKRKALDAIFTQSYPYTATVFKDGADEFIARLMEKFDVCFVTNSQTEKVQNKLGSLRLAALPPVHGDAKKNVLDNSWLEVPESVDLKDFNRPVFLRRHHYWTILDKLLKARQLTREQLLVAGDIYDMDLSIPHFMDSSICLVSRSSTPAHYVTAVSAYEHGFVVSDLHDGLTRILELTK